MRELGDGSKLFLGTDVNTIGKVSADGSTYSTISLDVDLGTAPNEFIVDGSDLFIHNNTTLSKYSISGATASFVTSVAVGSGAASMSFNSASQLLLSKGTKLKTFYKSDLTSVTGDMTAGASIARIGVNSSDLYYYYGIGGSIRSFITGSADEVSLVTGQGSGSAIKGFFVAADGSFYAATVVSSVGALKKWTAAGTQLWSFNPGNTTVAMSINANGVVSVLSSAGAISRYYPIATPSSFTATADSTNIYLSWSTAVTDSDFDGVTIRRSTTSFPETPASGTAVVTDSDANTFTDSGLSSSTSYYYSIWNKTSDGYYGNFTTATKTTGPVAPSLVAEASGSTVNLSWNLPAGTDSFTIRRSTSAYPTSPTDGTAVATDLDSSVTNYSDTSLSDNTYYYSIFGKRTSDAVYSGAGQATVTVDTTAPDAPAISASKPTLNGSSISLSWNVPTGTSTFTLNRVVNGGAETTVQNNIASSTTTMSQTSLSEGTYVYKIYAVDAYGNSSTAGASDTTTIDTTAPDAPTIVASKPTANGSEISLTWDVPSGTDTFTLKKVVDGGAETTVQSGIASSTTSMSQTSLSEGSYVYKIYAVDAYGNTSVAGTSSPLVIDTTAPSSPSSFTATSSGATVNLVWTNPASDFASVTIRRSTSSYPASIVSGTAILSGSTSTSYSNTGLSDGVYYYSAFALDSYGNISVAAQATATVDTTPPSSPTISASKPTLNGSSIDLSWDVPATTDHFDLKLIYNGGSESDVDLSIPTSTTSATKTSLADGTYVYKIYAIDSAGNVSSAGSASSLTIDTTATASPSAFAASVSGTQVNLSSVALSWSNPVASDFASITIRRSTSGYPADVSSGTLVASSVTSTTYTDSNLADGTYYYSAFALDQFGNISTAAQVTTSISTSTELSIELQEPSASGSIHINDQINFSLNIENSGNRDASDTELTFTISDNLQFVSAEITATGDASLASVFHFATEVSCTGTSTIVCNVGTVPAGESLTLVVTTTVVGLGAISFSVSGSDGISGDSASSSGTVVAVAASGGGCSLSLGSKGRGLKMDVLILLLGAFCLTFQRFPKRGEASQS